MMRGGLSGFHNAPVTRTLVISSAIVTVTSGLRGRSDRLGLSYQDIFENCNILKTIPSVFAFSSSPELIIGLYLVYYFRIFERQIGSNKYSVFVLFSSVVSTLLEIAALGLLKDSRKLASGLYGLIFASFVPFHFDIPVTSRVHIFGLHFTDKSTIYFAGSQLLLYSWKRSFIPGICGLVAGFLFRINAFGIRKLKFPAKIASVVSKLFLSSSTSSSRSLSANTRRNVHVPSVGRQVQQNNHSVGHIPVPEPPESAVATLVSMGFDSNAARQALVQARNDVNAATNILLEAQTR